MKKYTLTFILILLCVSNFVSAQTETTLNKQRLMLPNGWSISPAGKNLPLGDLPLNMAVSHNKKMVAVTNNGQSNHSIELILSIVSLIMTF